MLSELGTQALKTNDEWRLVPQIISFIVVRELQFVRMNTDLQLHLCIYYDMDSTQCICVTADNNCMFTWAPANISDKSGSVQ